MTCSGAFLKYVTVKNGGKNNTVVFEKGCRIKKCRVIFCGDNNKVLFGSDCRGQNIVVWCSEGSSVVIGKKADFTDSIQLVAQEGTRIKIGDNCLFADNVTFRTGDSHGIYDENEIRINVARNISVGNHVWFASNSTVLKGTTIGDECVIGTSSLLTGGCYKDHSVIAGNPAREKKHIGYWTHAV